MSSQLDKFSSLPRWFQRLIPLMGVIFSGLAFAHIWHRYAFTSLGILDWIRIGIIGIIGVMLLASAFVYFFHPEMGWKCLAGGLSLLPLLLLWQLVLFFIEIIKSVVVLISRGSWPEPVRRFMENYPSKFDIVILCVVGAVVVLWIVDKITGKRGAGSGEFE